jgi:hypothetical protein
MSSEVPRQPTRERSSLTLTARDVQVNSSVRNQNHGRPFADNEQGEGPMEETAPRGRRDEGTGLTPAVIDIVNALCAL